MKFNLFITRVQRVVVSLLLVTFIAMSWFCKDEFGLTKNNPITLVVMGVETILFLIWGLCFDLYSAEIEDLKRKIAVESKIDEENK